jgi:hypothetical protein
MKTALLALACLGVGGAIGLALTRREFARDILPVDVAAPGSTGAAKAGPRAVIVNNERHDFGTMDRNEHGTHVFIVRNDGDEPLTLATGQATCKCTEFSVDKPKIAPGEDAHINIKWNVKTSEAEFEQSGPLNTNDPRRPSIHLTVKGRVIDTVRAERSDIHFSDISANESASAALNIYGFRGDELIVENEKVSFADADLEKFFTVSFAPLQADEVAKEPAARSGLKMTVATKPGLPLGSFNQTVQFTTNQNAPALISVHLIGNAVSDIHLAGPRVDAANMIVGMGTIARGTAAKHTVYLLVKGPFRDQTQLSLASVEPAGELRATLGEPNRENAKIVRYPLTIETLSTASAASRMSDGAHANIRLTSTHPDVKEIAIKVRYVIKD